MNKQKTTKDSKICFVKEVDYKWDGRFGNWEASSNIDNRVCIGHTRADAVSKLNSWLKEVYGSKNVNMNKQKTIKPYTCPVCEGRGTVPWGFYNSWSTMGVHPETCRSCGGTGIVWGDQDERKEITK